MSTDKTLGHTGWIRYRIACRASQSPERWIFLPGLAEAGEEAIVDHIVRNHETWALHAPYYDIDYVTTEYPSALQIRYRINAKFKDIDDIRRDIETLERHQRIVLDQGDKNASKGYAFAYYAWLRHPTQPPNRLASCGRGATFHALFASTTEPNARIWR